jgi:uncharacterized repeat protein (TIGR01451 family)
MFTRVVQRKRPRASALLVIGSALAAAGLMATSVFATIPPPPADSGCGSIEVANKNISASCTTTDGAIVDYIGSSASNQSSGTGLFDPFVRLQGSPTEQGFNTNAPVTFDAKTGTWTHAILVSAIPVVTINGTRYWELFNDINEGNNSKPISLNRVEIWFTTNANITDGTGATFTGFATPATLQYAFSGSILINDVNQGSGRGDLRYLVPLTNIPTPPAGTYFVLYSQWGTTSAYNSDGGFEEWKVRKAPNVSILKTADAASVNAGANIGFTITVTNNGAADATGVTVNDPLPAGTGVDWSIASQSPAGSCSITGTPPSETLSCGPLTLASGGGQLTVHVTSATTAASCKQYDNTATITAGGTGSSTASTTVNCGALMILKQSTKTGNPLVSTAGAVFSITGPNSYSNSVTDNSAQDEDTTVGEVCVSGLAPGAYTVNETTAPSGYGDAGQTDLVATVANGTNCTSSLPGSAATATFTNPPLAEINVIVTDLGSGETNSSIVCAAGTASGTTVDAVSENGDADPAFDDTDETFTGLAPGTYTCTVVVDP